MKLLPVLARIIGLRRPRRRRLAGDDPADMGTAFGLDATTTVGDDFDEHTLRAAQAQPPAGPWHELDRRSRI